MTRPLVAMLACLGAVTVNLALADPEAPAHPQAAAATSTSSATVATPAAQSTPAATAAEKSAVDPREKQLISEGYKPEMHNGQKVYCRREQVLGSRLGEAKHCATLEQLGITTQNSHDQTDLIQRTQVNPGGH